MKHILLTTALLVFCRIAFACDVCGAGAGNSYTGILPDYKKRIAGIRFRHNSLLSHLGADGSITYLTTKESFYTVEAWGGWNLTPKLRLMASVPYAFNSRNTQGKTLSKNGPGDVTLSGYYRVMDKKNTIGERLFAQSLWAGVGIKLPTGKYESEDKSSSTGNTNLFQLGTGSTDISFNAMYDVRLQNAGMNISSGYRISTTNRHNYKYGNKFILNSVLYYKINLPGKAVISPNAGVQYEAGAKDLDNKFTVAVSGGNLLMGTIGTELSIGKMALGGNFQHPLKQALGNGTIKANDRVMMHFAISL